MIWGALAFFLVAAGGSGTIAGVRGLRTWRALKAAAGEATAMLADTVTKAEAVGAQALELPAGAERLAAAATRLHVSLAELAVVRRAAGEPRSLLRSARRAVR